MQELTMEQLSQVSGGNSVIGQIGAGVGAAAQSAAAAAGQFAAGIGSLFSQPYVAASPGSALNDTTGSSGLRHLF